VSPKRREVVALIWACAAPAIVLYTIAMNYGLTANTLRFDALVGADVLGLGLAFATVLIG
jgi:hypothetical protein